MLFCIHKDIFRLVRRRNQNFIKLKIKSINKIKYHKLKIKTGINLKFEIDRFINAIIVDGGKK